ncbi:MAG: hypothetical protein WD904_11320 [Dehalococcoidia bacterium]
MRSLLIVALGLLFLACGDGEDSDQTGDTDGGDTVNTDHPKDTGDLTLDWYFHDAAAIAAVHSISVGALRVDLDYSGEPLEVFHTAMSGSREALSVAITSMRELEPPAEADEHQAMIEAGEQYL